jgi:hypothetical protein
MSSNPTAPTPTGRAIIDPAQLVPTTPVAAAPVAAASVAAGEIAEFLRHLTDLRTSGRSADPAARAAFLHRKAELFTRLATEPLTSTSAPAPERRTP